MSENVAGGPKGIQWPKRGSGFGSWFLWVIGRDLADGVWSTARLIRRALIIIAIVLGVGVLALYGLTFFMLRAIHIRGHRLSDVTCAEIATLTTVIWLLLGAAVCSRLMFMAIAPKTYHRVTVRVAWCWGAWWQIASAIRTDRTLAGEVATVLNGLPDFHSQVKTQRGEKLWNLRTLDWDRPGAVKQAQRMLQAATDATVPRKDKEGNPSTGMEFPRITEGRKTARGVAIDIELPGGMPLPALNSLAYGFVTFFHTLPIDTDDDVKTGRAKLTRTSGVYFKSHPTEGNRATMWFNFQDPLAGVEVVNPLGDDEDDMEIEAA